MVFVKSANAAEQHRCLRVPPQLIDVLCSFCQGLSFILCIYDTSYKGWMIEDIQAIKAQGTAAML